MPNQLEQLREMTLIVADSGDLEAIQQHRPQDATTNPSLLLKAVASPAYAPLIDEALEWAKTQSNEMEQQVHDALDRLAVNVGKEVLKIIPGRVSTEIDARLSFATEATLAKAHKLVDMYQEAGISKDRILLKIASSWEGLKAAEQLEREGIHCNLTLMFGFAQARAAAEAGVTLISPFVGRILDWHKAQGMEVASASDDPGVQSVRKIYDYFKRHDYPTTVMGASFRNADEVRALAGCDALTVSPKLLAELAESEAELPRQLQFEGVVEAVDTAMSEAEFRWQMNEDAMATEKLAEGIRGFTKDQLKLEKQLAERL